MSDEQVLQEIETESQATAVSDMEPAVILPELTEREREVAALLGSGLTTHEVAERLGISSKTIDTHRGHLLKKLHVRNNAELAHKAIRAGLIELLP